MKHFKLSYAVIALLCLSGCSDSDPKDEPDGPQGSGSMTEMSPEDSKEFLTSTATEVLDLFNPADQSEAIDLAAYFDKTYGDLDLPDEFLELEEDEYASPAAYMKAIRRASSGDIEALTRAAYSYSYNINFDRFAGKYEPSRYQWVKTGNSKDIIFVFTDSNNRQCELKAVKAGGTNDFEYSYTDDYYWDTETYNYYLSIPKEVKVTLTVGGKVLAESKVVSDINIKGHTLNMEATASLCNLSAKGTVKGTDSKVEAYAEFTVGGKKAVVTNAVVNGNNLCNKDKIEDLFNEYYDEEEAEDMFLSMVTNGNCSADILGKVQVYGQIKTYDGMMYDLDGYWDRYDYDSKSMAEAACKRACANLNANIKTQVRYNGTTTDQANIVFVPYLEEWYSGWEYWIDANIGFPDGTTYSIDSYFNRFTTVTNKLDALMDAYERAWDNALRHN